MNMGGIIGLLVMMCGGVTDASVLTWQGLHATSGNWRNTTNWVGGVIPGNGDSLIFTGSTRMTNNNNNTAAQLVSLSNITFDSGAGGSFLITGTGIQLSGGITNNSSYLQRITMGLELVGDRNVNASAGDILLGGVISGAGGLTKSGAYTLTLTNQNTYTGTTYVQDGTLVLTNAARLPSNEVWLFTGATLDLGFIGTNIITTLYIDGVKQSAGFWGERGSGANHESILITGTGLLYVETGAKEWNGLGTSANWRQTANWGGQPWPVTGDDVAFAGTNRLAPSNNNTEGQLPYINSITFGSSAGSFSLASGYVLGIEGNVINNSTNTQTFNTMGLNLRANITIDAAFGNIVFNTGAAISGGYALTKDGDYTLTLSGAKMYTGNTEVLAGTLSVSSAFLNDSSNVRLTSGTTLNLNFSGTDTINHLYIDGILQRAGIWGAIGSGADYESGLITGTGVLSVGVIENNKKYTYIYFENGYPTRLTGRRPQSAANLAARANPDLVIQTGYYSLKFDCDDMTLQGYNALDGSDYLTALNQDVSIFSPATLYLAVNKGGTNYICTSALIQDLTNDYVRLIESGQFVQRFDHLGLAFSAENGTPLDGTGRFEMTAWPDRAVFKLDLTGIPGVTQAEVRVISPLGADHHAVAATNYVRLALRPQDDLLQPLLVPSNIITEAYSLTNLVALDCRFDEDECALHIDVPADKVSYPAATNRVDEYIIAVTNPAGLPANIPLIFDQPIPRAITGTVMTLCDENDGSPIGIPVQLSKNWHADANAPTIHQGPWLRGYTMVALGAGEIKRFRLRVIYGYWGGAGAASHSQLCLIGYGGNWKWDESALGAWGESMTYDPSQHLGSSFMADVRPSFTTSMKGGTHGWTENIGGGDFLAYYDSTNKFHWAKKLKTAYHWTGPNMTEVLYSGITDDEKIRFTYTTRLVRTSDYHRRFHAYQYEFLEDVTSPTRLIFHQMAADYYIRPMFTNYYRGDGTGLLASYICDPGGNVYKGAPIPFDNQWLAVDDIYSINGQTAQSRRGILSLSSTLNGNSFPLYLHTYGRSYGTNTILFDVSSDSVSRSYSAGNVVKGELEFILPPKAATNYWGSDAEFSTRLNSYGTNAWQAVADEFKYNTRLSVTMHQGALLRNYPVEIQASTASGDVLADFTVNSGGIGHVPVILKGVYGALQAQRYLNGAWVALESVEINQNNYYQGYRDVTGAMDCVFNFTRPSTNLNSSWRMRILKN